MLRILVSCLLAVAACADASAAVDPPSRVARLAYVRGPVSFSPAGTDDWAAASLNRPIIAGDRLWSDGRGRDELQLGGAALRMDGDTLLTVLTLDDRSLQVQLAQGTLNVRVRPGAAAGTVEVDTPNLALAMQQPGHYRVSVDPAGHATVVRVDDGLAQVYGQDQAYQVNPGQAFRFVGPDLRNVQALDPRQRDDFDRWSAERDRRSERALAARYVPPTMIGAEDLDDYGNWRTEPGYGPVWMPARVERGWAPYRDGHWAWIEPWGWTWIDDAPWGFAVTHYGRWANFGGNWGWVPGPARAEPVYAPALVVFAGAASLMAPRSPREQAVAWFPLGPREAYRPPYPASPRYLTAINNTTNVVNNVYVNRQVSGAATAVPRSVFTRAQPVRRAAITLPKDAIARAPVVASPAVAAQRESHASRLDAGHRPAPAMLARPVMTHMRPAIAAARGQAQPNIAAAHPLPPGAAPMPVPQPAHGRPFAAAPVPAHGTAPTPVPQPAHGQPFAAAPQPQQSATFHPQTGAPRPPNEPPRHGIPPGTAHANLSAGAAHGQPPEAARTAPAMQGADHAPADARPTAGLTRAGRESVPRPLPLPPQHAEPSRPATPLPAPASQHHEASPPHPTPAAPHREPPPPHQEPANAHREPPPHVAPAIQHPAPPPHVAPAIPHPAPPPHVAPANPHREPPPHPAPAAPAQPAPAGLHEAPHQHGPDRHKDEH
jgi:hypothetical protein